MRSRCNALSAISTRRLCWGQQQSVKISHCNGTRQGAALDKKERNGECKEQRRHTEKCQQCTNFDASCPKQCTGWGSNWFTDVLVKNLSGCASVTAALVENMIFVAYPSQWAFNKPSSNQVEKLLLLHQGWSSTCLHGIQISSKKSREAQCHYIFLHLVKYPSCVLLICISATP